MNFAEKQITLSLQLKAVELDFEILCAQLAETSRVGLRIKKQLIEIRDEINNVNSLEAEQMTTVEFPEFALGNMKANEDEYIDLWQQGGLDG